MLATMASINDVLRRAQGNDTPVTCRIDNEDVSMVAVRITVQTLLLGKEGVSILVSLIIILLLPLGLPENRERDSLNFSIYLYTPYVRPGAPISFTRPDAFLENGHLPFEASRHLWCQCWVCHNNKINAYLIQALIMTASV